MSDVFSAVDRPEKPLRGGMGPLTQAILDTLETGGAVRVVLNGRVGTVLRTSIDQTTKKRGLKLFMRTEADRSAVLFWVEKREAK